MRLPLLALLTHLRVTSILVSARLGTNLDLHPITPNPNGGQLRPDDIKLFAGKMDLNSNITNSNITRTRRLDDSDEEIMAGTAEAALIFNRSDHMASGLTYDDLYADPYNTSEPGYDATQDPFSLNFYAYQNQDVIEPWMLDFLRGMYHIRKAEGVQQPLCFNEKLVSMAKAHVLDIVEQELLLSHIGTDGKNSGERLDDIEYNMTSYGATISATECTDVKCAIVNRPLFFTKQNKYNQLGIAKEEYDPKGNPRWYYVFAASDTETCFGMNVSQIDWPEGTPTMAPVPERILPPVIPNDGGDMIEDWMIGLLALLNSERKNEGVDDLCFNKKLAIAAQNHNKDMVDNGFMSHTGTNNTTPAMRVTSVGYNNFSYVSENVATGQETVKDTMYAWMSSTGQHAYNVINPNAKHIGLARNESTGTYTLVFGNYFTDVEACISTVHCEGTTSFLEGVDPDYSKYSCSLCLENTPFRQFGVMGCGFGLEWYRKNSIEDYHRRA